MRRSNRTWTVTRVWCKVEAETAIDAITLTGLPFSRNTDVRAFEEQFDGLLKLTSGGNARLEELRQQESIPVKWGEKAEQLDETGWPTDDEILELWHTFKDAAGYVGYTPTMRDFGQWLAGVEGFEGCKPAEVTW